MTFGFMFGSLEAGTSSLLQIQLLERALYDEPNFEQALLLCSKQLPSTG
jgi:hypothetical protein